MKQYINIGGKYSKYSIGTNIRIYIYIHWN